MNTHRSDDFSCLDKPAFNVLVAYDEVAMGVRAKHVLDSITRTLEAECKIVVNLWKFSMLQRVELADSAVLEAVVANLIILALREDNGVPKETKAWIETWLQRRAGAAGALVLVFDPAQNSSTAVSPIHRQLLEVGERGKLDVFALRDESDWDALRWGCAECNQFHVARPPTRPLFKSPADRLGKPAPCGTPLLAAIPPPVASRSISVG
ncbi:MAG: hypothetical protein EBS05_18945 [Proteobacteria bacterium]|nr:hypothetical protein [Pseudomonadota bacterium]